MSTPAHDIAELLRRFVDERDSLTEVEYAQLVDGVRQSPVLAAQLRDQLMIDDILSQSLAIDRRQFDAQVQQRLADHVQGEQELNEQADALRKLALARLEQNPSPLAPGSATWIPLTIALSLLLVAGMSIWAWQRERANGLMASVESVQGQVVVRRASDHDQLAQASLNLRQGDRLIVGPEATITLRWLDGTRVQLREESTADISANHQGKYIYLEQGDASALVAKQPAGQPMIFATPHADAIVRGTQLTLHVLADETQLEVAEGKVEFVEHRTHDSQLIAASEAAVATAAEKIVKQAIRWPASREGLLYLFTAPQPTPLLRRETFLQPSPLESPAGPALYTAQGEIDLSRRSVFDRSAGQQIAQRLRTARALTLELALAADALDNSNPQAILSLESAEGIVFCLTQKGDRLYFGIDASPSPSAPSPANFDQASLAVELHDIGPIPAADRLVHMAITISGEQFIASVAGEATTRKTGNGVFQSHFALPALRWGDSQFLPANNHWRGRIGGLAIYDRALTAAELDRNEQGFRK